jgi:hypothetical protein
VTPAQPEHARIRSYNVGFGDSFLLTFTYAGDDTRNVLIDFGSTKQSDHAPEGEMPAIAKQIRDDCGGKLEIVVATHRHRDHISGFGGDAGKIIASLEPELVLQPWTEDPDLEPEATAPAPGADAPRDPPALVARLANMQAVAQAVSDQVPRLRASPSVRKVVREQVEFLGEVNLANREAVENLMTMGRQSVYAHFGTALDIGELLPGVDVEVLGPPTLEQSAEIADQREVDRDEFWHLAAVNESASAVDDRAPGPLFPDVAMDVSEGSQEARWVIPEIERMHSEELLALVRVLDSELNNTSLILLFDINGTLLLFPGDAQIENWNYALKTAENHEAIRERLARASFYKVGHHGSLNATPKTLWKNFANLGDKSKQNRLVTMVSTLAGKHGSVERHTEVPRQTLIAQLEERSRFSTTEALLTADPFWNDVEFDF